MEHGSVEAAMSVDRRGSVAIVVIVVWKRWKVVDREYYMCVDIAVALRSECSQNFSGTVTSPNDNGLCLTGVNRLARQSASTMDICRVGVDIMSM